MAKGNRRKSSPENDAVPVDNPAKAEKDQVSPMTKKVTTVPMVVTPPGGKTVQTTVEITEYLTIAAARKELGDGVVLKHLNDALAQSARTRRRNEIVSGGVEKRVDSVIRKLQKINPDVAKAAMEAWNQVTATPAVENASNV